MTILPPSASAARRPGLAIRRPDPEGQRPDPGAQRPAPAFRRPDPATQRPGFAIRPSGPATQQPASAPRRPGAVVGRPPDRLFRRLAGLPRRLVALPRRLAAALVLVLAVALTGCAGIPTTSAVNDGLLDPAVQGDIQLDIDPQGPADQDPPSDIVRGFLQAVQSDNFATARDYLSPAIAQEWDPYASVLVYASGRPADVEGPDVTATAGTATPANATTSIRVTFGQSAGLDRDWRYQPAPVAQQTVRTVSFVLEPDARGQWRIAEMPEGIILSDDIFAQQFKRTIVYFPGPSGTVLVPDVRWFPIRTAATALVNAVLKGPPGWLSGAVVNLVPAGTHLVSDSVPVADGVATVNLSAEFRTAEGQQQALLAECLRRSLLHLPGITRVVLQVDSVDFSVPSLQRMPAAGLTSNGNLYYVIGDALWYLASGRTNRAIGFDPEVGLDLDWLTVSPDELTVAGLTKEKTLVVAQNTREEADGEAQSGGPRVWAQDPDQIYPAFDSGGWLWLGTCPPVDVGESTLSAFAPAGKRVNISAEWLRGYDLLAFAPARDGVRMALAIRDRTSGVTSLVLSGILRGPDGGPRELSEPEPVASFGSGRIAALAWSDEVTVAALAASMMAMPLSPWRVPIGDVAANLTSPSAQVTGLAADYSNIYITVQSEDGSGEDLYVRAGQGWTAQVTGASLPAFPSGQ